MGALEKIYEVLATNEAKRERFRNFLLFLMVEWKNFEGHMDLTWKRFQECIDELQSRESLLRSVQESVTKSSKEIDLMRDSILLRLEELEEKGKETFLLQEKGINELGLREQRLRLICQEIEVREEKLTEQETLVQGLCKKIEVEKKQFEVLGNSVGELLTQNRLKEDQIERKVKEIDLKLQMVINREKEVEIRETILDLKKRSIELKERKSYLKSKKHWLKTGSHLKCSFQMNGKGRLAHSWLKKKARSVRVNIATDDEQNASNYHNKNLVHLTFDSRTFWTCCPYCGVRYDYFRYVLNKTLTCKNCLKSFVVFSRALGDQGYAISTRIESNSETQRNTDIGGYVRTKVVAMNLVDAPVGDLVGLAMNATAYRKSGELQKYCRKRSRSSTATKAIPIEPIFGVDSDHCSRRSSEQMKLVARIAAVKDADDVARSSRRLRRITSCSCCGEELSKVSCHNHS